MKSTTRCAGPSEKPKKPYSFPSALEHFPKLPNDAYVRLPVVAGLLGVSGSTIWRMVREKRIPAPHRIGSRVSAWSVGELRAVLGGVK